jgi:hypothetical protein
MSELEAMRHPRRHEVYRDVGSERREVADPGFAYVAEFDLPPGAALLLCSDGLTDLVPSETIRQIVGAHASAPDRVVRGLIAAANDAGGRDNVTAVYAERIAAPVPGEGRQPMAGALRPRGARQGRMPVVLAIGTLVGFALGLLAADRGWGLPEVTGMTRWSPPIAVVVVRPGESIMAAVAEASPGATVLVEPGDYRERITLRDGVRVVSRVPRGATIRLPAGVADGEAAVVAAGVVGAEFSGFRIVGDDVAPLGVGVITRDAAVRLSDLDISGALTSAVDLGAGEGVVLSGSHVHDNPGAALVVRAGAAPRVTHNVFARNASSDRLSAPVIVEAGASGEWSENVFSGMTLRHIAGLDAPLREHLPVNNLIVAPPPAPSSSGRGGRGP